MYFPLLRGKQFELIALRELSSLFLTNAQKISPIVEPVKDSSALRLTLRDLTEKKINFNLILNSMVGDLKNDKNTIFEIIEEELSDYSNYQISFYVNDDRNIGESIRLAQKINTDFNGFSFIHTSQVQNLDDLRKFDKINKTVFQIVDISISRRYHRNFSGTKIISLEDHFTTVTRNSDYAHNPDEFFSEEHLFYKDDGFYGFADYLTIGEPFSESGFLPYAIVIHLTYPDSDKKIRIHHFVSDTNEDTSDIGGKFDEALNKLVKWVAEKQIKSEAINEFNELHRTGHFPGLGYVKKLSIKHHIELTLSLI